MADMIRIHEQPTNSPCSVGWITLEQPQSLNALTLDMVLAIRQQLEQWAARADIACVVIQGSGRAFCAGGDVRRMRQGILAGDDYCERFFEQEYRLDHAIHRYAKPLLVWGHGVVMGGGLGLLVGASHRVVTGSTRLAMPETSIGLYPDVGASWFLNRLPPGLGLFLGITGCEWNGADALALGLADFLLDDKALAELPDALANSKWTFNTPANRMELTGVLDKLAQFVQPEQLIPYSAQIAAVCQGTLEQAIHTLAALPIEEAWFKHAIRNLETGCPVTVRIIEEQLQRGKSLSLAEALRMEWNLSVQCCIHADFPEGVRAQLVDKDKNPQWQFNNVESVPREYVLEHFVPPCARHPLDDLD